jgi:hypothetical protein
MLATPTENEINFIEAHIPELAEVAFKQAFWQTLADGVSVIIAENHQLVELFPDGSKKIIKQLSKPQIEQYQEDFQ